MCLSKTEHCTSGSLVIGPYYTIFHINRKLEATNKNVANCASGISINTLNTLTIVTVNQQF